MDFNEYYKIIRETVEKAVLDFNDLNDLILRYKTYGSKNFGEWIRCKDDLYEEWVDIFAGAIIDFPEIADKQEFLDLVNMIKFSYRCVDKEGNPSLYSEKTRRLKEVVKYDFKENILKSLSSSDKLETLKTRAEKFMDGHPVPITNEEFEQYKGIRQVDVEFKHNPIKMMYLEEYRNIYARKMGPIMQ